MKIDPQELQEFLNGVKPTEANGDSPTSQEVEANEDQADVDLDAEDKLNLRDKDDDFFDINEEESKDKEPDEEPNETDEEPEIESTPEEQSKDKDNPANKAFAKLNRKLKELQSELKEKDNTLENINKQFSKLAESSGFKGIETADQYVQALSEQSNLKRYRQTNDPNVLLQLAEERVMKKLAPVMSHTQKAAEEMGKNKFEAELKQHINDLNETYGTKIQTPEDIVQLPNADKIIERMGKGDTLSEAYLLANKDIIFEQHSRKSRQAAVNTAKGFSHQTVGASTDLIDSDGLSREDINTNLPSWQMIYPEKSKQQLIKMMKVARKRGDM